ncbi:MAG: PAS domain-containing protein [Deltaproteobacteria bacterium]|nr:PAS domain-containing protein [Deltaproteobacteria bacterium]
MNTHSICESIVASLPYPVVFVDLDHVIQYMNPAAKHHYCTERGHGKLVGKSLFDCHFNPASQVQIETAIDKFKKDAKEFFLKVNDRNLRVYVSPVKTPEGELVGYYERFEMNLQLPPAQPAGPLDRE